MDSFLNMTCDMSLNEKYTSINLGIKSLTLKVTQSINIEQENHTLYQLFMKKCKVYYNEEISKFFHLPLRQWLIDPFLIVPQGKMGYL